MPNVWIDYHALCSGLMDCYKFGDFEGSDRWNHLLFTMLGRVESKGDGTK
jgi:hypothetical protein